MLIENKNRNSSQKQVQPELTMKPVNPELKTNPVKPALTTNPMQPVLITKQVTPVLKRKPVTPVLKTNPVKPVMVTFKPPTKDNASLMESKKVENPGNVKENGKNYENVAGNVSKKGTKKVAKKVKVQPVGNKIFKEKKQYSFFAGLANDLNISSQMSQNPKKGKTLKVNEKSNEDLKQTEITVPLANSQLKIRPTIEQETSPPVKSDENISSVPVVSELKPGKNDCGDCAGCQRKHNCQSCKFCQKPSLKKKCQLRLCTNRMSESRPIPLKSLPVSALPRKVYQSESPDSSLASVEIISPTVLVQRMLDEAVAGSSQSGMSSSGTARPRQLSGKTENRRGTGEHNSTNRHNPVTAKKKTTVEKTEKEKVFKCPRCGKTFVFPKWLVNHMKKDSCKKVMQLKRCPLCRKEIKSTYYNTHLKIHITAKIRCRQCACSFKSGEALEAHRVGVHVPRPKIIVRCDECEQQFSNDRVLKQHITKCHKEKTLACDECKAMFSTTNGLRKHKLNHDAITKLIDKEDEVEDDVEDDDESNSDQDEENSSHDGDHSEHDSNDDLYS